MSSGRWLGSDGPVRGWRVEFGPAEFVVVMTIVVFVCIVTFSLCGAFRSFQPKDFTTAPDGSSADDDQMVEIVGAGESMYYMDKSSGSPSHAISKTQGRGRDSGVAHRVRSNAGDAGDVAAGDARSASADGVSGPARKESPDDSHAGSVVLLTRVETQPEWSVPYGREFWHGLTTTWAMDGSESPADAASHVAPQTRSMADIVECVEHAIKAEAEGGNLTVTSRNYSATFVPEGFNMTTPRMKRGGGTTEQGDRKREAAFRTVRANMGAQTLFDAASGGGAWGKYALCNIAQALLNREAGLIEHVEARDAGLAVSWVLDHQATATTDLVIHAELNDTIFAGVTSAGFHFWDGPVGQDFLMRHAVAMDARGQSWLVAMSAGPEGITMRIPKRCLVEATQPLVIESWIAPSTGFSREDSSRPSGTFAPGGTDPGQAYREASYGSARFLASPEPVIHDDFPSATDAAELASLMEIRDRLVMFHGLAWSHVHDGIPYDRDILKAQWEAWQYLADSREARAARRLETFQIQMSRLDELLVFHRSTGYENAVKDLSLSIQNFMILPFSAEGDAEANRLEEKIYARLPSVYYEMQLPRTDPYVLFTTLRQATRDAGMFHYYTTAAIGTRMGAAADWSRRLADYDAHSNAYDLVRKPLFARNAAVPVKIEELGEITDRYLDRIRSGADTAEPFRAMDAKISELKSAVRDAPLSHCGDMTIARQMAKLRLAYAELLGAKRDFSDFSSPSFDGAKVQTLLASIEEKLRSARDEAVKQLVEPAESTWTMLGIRNRDEARAVLRQRNAMAEKLGRWQRHFHEWHEAVVRQPKNNFATMKFLTAFARNKAEWDHLVVTEIYPVAWQYPAKTARDMMKKEEWRKGSPLELSVNTVLADLQDVWTCYGDY